MSAPIHHEITFTAPPDRVYEALMDSAQHSAFTGEPAEISREAGGPFSCYAGQLVGRNIELVANERIVQAWRIGMWDDGVYSIVKLDLRADGDGTKLVMDHSGVPEAHRGHIDTGWHNKYWEPLQKFFS